MSVRCRVWFHVVTEFYALDQIVYSYKTEVGGRGSKVMVFTIVNSKTFEEYWSTPAYGVNGWNDEMLKDLCNVLIGIINTVLGSVGVLIGSGLYNPFKDKSEESLSKLKRAYFIAGIALILWGLFKLYSALS